MNTFKYFGLVIMTTFFMGIAFPVGKLGLSYAPPFYLMGLRYVLAGGILALLTWRKPLPRGINQWLQAACIGIFQSAGVMGCVYFSMRWITSGESAIITCINPLIVIVLGTLLTGKVYKAHQWLGVAVGFAGVAVSFGFHMNWSPGVFISFAGACCFACATLLVNRWGAGFDMTVLAAYQMLAGGIALLALSGLTEQPAFVVTGTSVAVMLCLVILCSIVQFSVWFYLLRSGDPAKTSSFLFLAPIFGVLSSWLLLGENISWEAGAGGALVCLGIYLVNRKSRPASSSAIPESRAAGSRLS